MGKRDLAKKERDTFMQILKHKFTHTYMSKYPVTHIKTDQRRASIHTHTHTFIHMHLCAPPPLNMH